MDLSSRLSGRKSFLRAHQQQECLIPTTLYVYIALCSYSVFSQPLPHLILRTASNIQQGFFFLQTRRPSFRYWSMVTQLLSNKTGPELWPFHLEFHVYLMTPCFLSILKPQQRVILLCSPLLPDNHSRESGTHYFSEGETQC